MKCAGGSGYVLSVLGAAFALPNMRLILSSRIRLDQNSKERLGRGFIVQKALKLWEL
jgi:hypothetical protein